MHQVCNKLLNKLVVCFCSLMKDIKMKFNDVLCKIPNTHLKSEYEPS
jgi:hypothetical protein